MSRRKPRLLIMRQALANEGKLHKCPICGGAGWTPTPRARGQLALMVRVDWAVVCSACDGYGFFTRAELCKRLDEWPSTLRRAFVGRSSARVCVRLLAKLASTFPEMFQAKSEPKRQPKEKA